MNARVAVAAGWWVYILECRDGSLYTGATNDLDARVQAHSAGRGARYTRGRAPFRLVYCEACVSRPAALRREAMIKRLRRVDKLALIAENRG